MKHICTAGVNTVYSVSFCLEGVDMWLPNSH